VRRSGTSGNRRGRSCVGSGDLAVFLLFLLSLATLHAQYVVHSWAVAGGSGASSGGSYRVTGSIGPSDAGAAMAGGDYLVVGGYWAAVAVDPGLAPTLAIEMSAPGELRITWAPDLPGWVLQERSSLLSPSEWVTIPTGTANPTAIQADDATKFYRLMRSE
jgi:hypothetical protein